MMFHKSGGGDRFPTVYQEARVALMTAREGKEGLGQLSKVALKVIDNRQLRAHYCGRCNTLTALEDSLAGG